MFGNGGRRVAQEFRRSKSALTDLTWFDILERGFPPKTRCFCSSRSRCGTRRIAITARPVRVNERIRIREVRLIDEDGKQLGIIPTREALETARERGLDLVEVQPNAIPPVCRLMDYGRFRYEESRKERESRRRAKTAVVKEVRLYPKIGEHDIVTKSRQAQRFLEDGDKVKVAVLFRGREMLHTEIGRGLLDRVVAELSPVAVVEQPPKMEGRTMAVLLGPKEPPKEASRPAGAERSADSDAGSNAAAVPDS